VSTLHITNGDCAASILRTFIADPVAVTADVLHEGPAPADLEGGAWRTCREHFHASAGYNVDEATRGRLAESEQLIASAQPYDEVVLWFEHDLFDQLLLIRTLDTFGQIRPATPAASLICIDRFPGVERFIGLGQLTAAQLATLTDTRKPVTPEQYALARDAWRAFRAANPKALVELTARLTADTITPAALPFLGSALRRFLEEYPSTTNGLSRTADAALRAVAAGPLDGGRLFFETQTAEEHPFIGDTSFFLILRRLADARVPLVTIEPDGDVDLRGRVVTITDAGRRVVSGEQDAVALNGIDEWRGGVHLVGAATSPLRWDPHVETLIS
jgi:hypothetical protein